MDHADDGDDDDVFIYMGGDQQVPGDVTHVRVHKSVKIITESAFFRCYNLVSIEMHDGVEIIEEEAFWNCTVLIGIKLIGVKVIEGGAFSSCYALADVEFGDKLKSIGENSFNGTSLKNIKLPKVRVIGNSAFACCDHLTDAEFSEDLETVGEEALAYCPHLRRIAIPLKDDLLLSNSAFSECGDLSQVDLVGGIHKTISSLLLESWRNEMNYEIDRINQDLPNTATSGKTAAIRRWMEIVTRRLEHFKLEHYVMLKDDMMQLELALWKANLPNVDAVDANLQNVRHEARVTCGANIIIPHVMSFLNDTDEFPLRDYNL